jgi:hypothetical protein
LARNGLAITLCAEVNRPSSAHIRILEYSDLDTSRVTPQYEKVVAALAREDFRAADASKLVNTSHGKLYRAKLDHVNRLLFCLLRYQEEVCALMLELIEHHDYGRSRFLRGAAIDESKIVPLELAAASAEARPVRYLHPQRTRIHLLDKPISFDDAQDAIYRQPAPLIVVGSAGSGKTALTLEKLKHIEGEVLYVTQSAYLARNARDLYYAGGFEHAAQEASFLSYREFIESIRIPAGREASWRDFRAWFERHRQQFRHLDAHQAFEEIRGVITATAGGALSRADYEALGVRQSIFAPAHRPSLYDLFERYRAWLTEAGLYDLNLIAQAWGPLAAARFDFVIVDEVQDLTAVQLALVLKTLKTPGQFLLCGDSNQIVHPNFFSWSQVKSLFWRDPSLAQRQQLHVLTTNFRNAELTAALANSLLKIKQQRFGSVDRESNFLVQSTGAERGSVTLLPDKDPALRALDASTRGSVQAAILVLRDEDKPEARKRFATPLVFSVHEAKGLEYESIVLYRFISDHRGEFAEIVAGVSAADLLVDTLEYRRASDKTDKSLEIYKFFINALYVAVTRAMRNLYLVESDTQHPLFRLLGLRLSEQAALDAPQASLDDWQREARKLELQGKQEQADAIRNTILKQTPPPWPVLDESALRETLVRVFREQLPGDKQKRRLFEYAGCHDEPGLALHLDREAGFGPARGFEQQRASLARKYLTPYQSRHFKDVLRQCDRHGLEHRTAMNHTPLMAAAIAGNVPLVEALIEGGADREAADHYGRNALHGALLAAFADSRFARGPFAQLYELTAPASLDVKVAGRLVRIDRHLSEYLLFQTLWALFKSRFTHPGRRPYCAFDTATILQAWQHLPPGVLRPERNRRAHLSAVLARNEVERDYAYNRALFARISQGWYQFNPALEVRCRGTDQAAWQPALAALNLPLIGEFALETNLSRIDACLTAASLPSGIVPVALERRRAQQRAAQPAAPPPQIAPPQTDPAHTTPPTSAREEPRWGTPEARRRAREQLQQRIDAMREDR